ncbi:alpha/beta fold hydrolase [Ferrovum sp. PN-J185]|uniref:alpha/beta fold hydrolase n=1 Tax=Ferrovum sp. PN-J185 TaxID=1356306 RepID=UPI00079A88B2|nr:alpha/beta fold hydrolase [Ferrovum sp. PN-J185]KXW56839.1 homoserine O-acetyltransferase [Ferrovum sp. PN-J185]
MILEFNLENKKEYLFQTDNFRFNNGQTLASVTIGITSFGYPKFDADGQITNAILLLHGTSGTAESWFIPSLTQFLFTSNNPLNQKDYFFIVPDSLGHGRSSKPSDKFGMNFPHYGYLDMVHLVKLAICKTFPITCLFAVIGTSMGGMHTWLMALEFKRFIRKAVAIACMPYEISGRNLLWRKIITSTMDTIVTECANDTVVIDSVFKNIWPLFSVMTDSATHLQRIAPNREKSLLHHTQLINNSSTLNAVDMMYRLSASFDYNPEPHIEKLDIPFLMINFKDDLLTPLEVMNIQELLKRNSNLTINIIDPDNNFSFGHQNLSQGKIWGTLVDQFIR